MHPAVYICELLMLVFWRRSEEQGRQEARIVLSEETQGLAHQL